MSMDIYTPNDTDVIHSTKADFRKRTIQETVHLVQYEKNLPVIAVALMYNGYSYTAPATSEIWIRWGKKDHTYVYKKCMVSADRKTVYFEVDYQMTYYYGELNPILELIIGSKSAGSSPLPIMIDRNPIQESDQPSETYDDMLQEIREEVATAEARIQAKTTAGIAELDEKTTQCKQQIQNKTDECIQSIPSDYSALEARVDALEENYDRYEWNEMIQAIRNGHGDNYHTGDQLLIDWRDNTNNVNYVDVEHNIVDHTNAIVKVNGVDQTVYALTVEWHYTIPFGLAFDPSEDMAQVKSTGMPAGRYYFLAAGDSWGGNNGKYFAFVLPASLVEGNRLRPDNSYNALFSTGKMRVYADGKSFTDLFASSPIDIVETDSNDSGTYLGTLYSTSDQGQSASYFKQDTEHGVYLNHYHRILFGYNRWRDSLYRQWLNADGNMIDIWEEQNVFDRAPSNIASLKGFLTGYDSQFKNVLRQTKISTYRNTITDDGGLDITYDKIFLRSMANMNVDGFSTQQNTGGSEGPNWEYYQNLAIGQSNLNNNGTFKAWNTYAVLIKYALNAKTSAQYVFGRAAYRGSGYGVLRVYTSGDVSSSNAGNGHRCLPACIIS